MTNESQPSADKLLVAAKAALAALSQNATFPADIAAARKWLSDAIREIDGADELDRIRNYFGPAHQGDPCIRCGVAHDDVPPGPCKGRL
jgi:hypothetical protein